MENHSIINPAVDLGTVDYLQALELQRKLVRKVREGGIGDIILILDHPPVYTVGRGKNEKNYSGIDVVETERGGDVTYHGPGQIVIYPIINLIKNNINGPKKYVELIEDIVINSLKMCGYEAKVGEEPGIWINGKKVGSIGMAIKDGIAFHGISINTSPKVLEGFRKIRACGLDPSVMYYIDIERKDFVDYLLKNFSIKIHEFHLVSREFFYSNI